MVSTPWSVVAADWRGGATMGAACRADRGMGRLNARLVRATPGCRARLV